MIDAFEELDPGLLRHLVTLQRLDPNVQYDTSGDIVSKWDTIGTYWAFVRPLNGRELLNAKQLVDQISHQITMRDVGPITAKDRFIFQGRVLGIDYILNNDEFNAQYDIYVHELVGETP